MSRNLTIVFILALPLSTAPASARQAPHSQAANAASRSASSSGGDRNQRSGYVGDEACEPCHADKVQSFHQTAHYLTSRLPTANSILGSFAAVDNILKTANPQLSFQMDQKSDGKDAGFFQTEVLGTAPYVTTRAERFAFVVGSGGKGQTYLYWKDGMLFELPVSYWRVLGWVNSPGYRDGFADFGRPIIPRCLECHATYFRSLAPPPNRYRPTGFELGIQCEKCHGPGRNHVERESSKTGPAEGTILNPARFSRERQIDLCSWCHAGVGESSQPAFSYIPGEPLDKYLELPSQGPHVPLDVHGNQVALLKQSRCYASSTMTCLTCHDVHAPQHSLPDFSQRCLSCHKPDSATFAKAGHPVSANCIDCHMPRQETNLIVFDSKGRKEKPLIRNHWIKVYSDSNAPASP